MGRHRPPVTACQHADRRHYALGMCRPCYARFRRAELRG